MEMRVCPQCNRVVEVVREVKYEGGTTYTEIKCPECGHIVKDTRNHVHYGKDGYEAYKK